jgi:hypothetical protein
MGLCILWDLVSFFFFFLGWGETESIWYAGHYFSLLLHPRMMVDDDERGAIGGM